LTTFCIYERRYQMFIQVEPVDFFMYSVKLFFDLEEPNSEDQAVRDYLMEHELEPKQQGIGELDGHKTEIMRFGGCYLGRHLDRIAQIQRHAVEVELLTATIAEHLKAPLPGGASLSAEERQTAIPRLVQDFHQESSFQKGENGELVAALDGSAVREAAHRLLIGAPSG
jgi:hypothetical protein